MYINRKGYLQIHVAVNIKIKEIIAFAVTDEKVHDSKMLKKLVNHVLDNHNKKKIKSVLADGAHDTNMNFRYLEVKKIIPSIKIRSNSIVSPKNNRLRNKESIVTDQEPIEMEKEKKVWTEMCMIG